VRGLAGKLFAAVLLTLCVGIHALEVSGRWDQTFQDANDEAGIVAVVLCVGVAFAAARSRSRAVRLARVRTLFRVRSTVAKVLPRDVTFCNRLFAASPPPLPLRI
jgi:hypothetical protein